MLSFATTSWTSEKFFVEKFANRSSLTNNNGPVIHEISNDRRVYRAYTDTGTPEPAFLFPLLPLPLPPPPRRGGQIEAIMGERIPLSSSVDREP